MSISAVGTTDSLKSNPLLLRLTEAATPLLRAVVGHSSDPVSAEWDRGRDGRSDNLVLLRLRDSKGEVTGIFEQPDLEQRTTTELKLHRYVGDLLDNRLRVQISGITGNGA
jgi:hypothetical protein